MHDDDPFRMLDDFVTPRPVRAGWVRVWTFWLIFFPTIAASAVLFALAEADVSCGGGSIWNCIDHWVHRYQTLIAAAAAVVTIFVLRSQIAEARSAEARNVARAQIAARAYLPLALTEVCEYAEECMIRLDKHRIDRLAFVLPDIPQNAIEAIHACIATAAKEQAIRLAAILSDIQVQRARLRGRTRRLRSSTISDGIFDSAELYARSESLFEWARRTSSSAPNPHRRDIQIAIRVAGVEIRHYPLISKRMEIYSFEDEDQIN